MSDPTTIVAYKGWKRAFALRLLSNGSPIDLTSKTLVAGIEKQGSTAWCRFRCTGHGTHGTLSGTIPSTIGFTGGATMRIWSSGAPTGARYLVADKVLVRIDSLSANWLTG